MMGHRQLLQRQYGRLINRVRHYFPFSSFFWSTSGKGAQPAFKENILPEITLLDNRMGHPGKNHPCQTAAFLGSLVFYQLE